MNDLNRKYEQKGFAKYLTRLIFFRNSPEIKRRSCQFLHHLSASVLPSYDTGVSLGTLSKKGKFMRKLILLFLTVVLVSSAVSAQKISGIVKDQSGKALAKTTVSLLRAKDSTTAKLSVTDNDGRFNFQAEQGKYLVGISHVGYQPYFSRVIDLTSGDATLADITLAKAEKSLQGVTVTSQKPIVEVKADKTILNVEGTINATGSDALELLRKSPGVMVDKDDNLSIAGKTGVQVYIDGKPSPLTGQDLSNYLKTLQASQIEAIEIITNPSAKYEAAGNAGIINIKLKKNKTFGTNGSINAGYNIGTYPKYNGGFSLNHRNKRVNIFGNYNYNNSKNLATFRFYKEQFDSVFDQTNSIVSKNKSHNFKAGADYFLNAKSTVGVMVNGNLSDFSTHTEGPMYIYRPNGDLDRILQASSENDGTRNNVNANINYRYAVTGGTELNIDGDYGFYKIRSNQVQPNIYTDKNGNEISRVVYNMISPTDIDLYSTKVDYERNYKGGRLGLGGKLSYVNTDNDFQRYNVYNNGKVLDTLKSNLFKYKENINALYVNYNKAFKGFMIQAGLRMENTNSKGISTGYQEDNNGNMIPYDSSFKRNYTDFFPSAAITFNKNPMSQFSFTYSRRIDRPAYQDLNPFEFKLNEYTFMKGNTMLRPQYTNSIGLTHTYKYKLNTTLNYSHVKDMFAQIPDTTEKTKSFLTKRNIATQNVVSMNVSYPFQYKWYSFFANLSMAYSHYTADYGDKNNPNDDDRKIDQGAFSLQYYMQNTFKLGKGWTGELSGFYLLPGLWQGVFKSTSIYGVDGGFQKTLFKNKATARLSVSDMFHTMKWSGTSNYAGVYSKASGRWESTQLKLAFTYRFGNTQVKQARQRKSGIDDENKRTNGSGNTPVGQ